MCTGEWQKVHLPVYKSSLVEFFTSTHGSNCFPCPLDAEKSLGQRIKRSPFWIETLFDRSAKGVKKTHVDALLLSLACAGIITIQRINDEDRWDVARTSPGNVQAGTPVYLSDNAWSGINLHYENRKRVRDPSEQLTKQADTVHDKAVSRDGNDDESDDSDN